jgi:hypothetical protein
MSGLCSIGPQHYPNRELNANEYPNKCTHAHTRDPTASNARLNPKKNILSRLRACYHPSKDMIGIRHSTLSESVATTPGDAQSVIKSSPATWTAVGTIVHSKRWHYRILHIYCMARQETSRVCAATGARQNAPADSYPRAKRAVHQDLGPTNRIPLFYNQWRGFHFNFCFGKRTSFLKHCMLPVSLSLYFVGMSRLVMMVWSASLASRTCFLLSIRYLSTSSLPPPGLYSPNCEIKAMLLLILVAEFQSSAAS